MSDTSVCATIPNGLVYVIVVGCIVAALGTIGNMLCPFLSNSMQNRIHNRNTGLLQLANEQLNNQRESYNV